MKRATKRTLLTAIICGVLFTLTSAYAFAQAGNEQPLDEGHFKITVQQGYS